jgi:hypothetical protein
MKQTPLRKCHGAQGDVGWTDVLSGSPVKEGQLSRIFLFME